MDDRPRGDQPRYLVGQTMVHINASLDVEGLKELQDALPMLISLISLRGRRAAPLETGEDPAESAAPEPPA